MNSNPVYVNRSVGFGIISQDSGAELVARAKQGEEAAFSQLYKSHFDKVYRFIYYRVSHKEVAEDLTEDVFLKAYKAIVNVSNNSSFEGWLFQIARNTVVDYYRSKKTIVALEEIENAVEYEVNILDIAQLRSDQQLLLKLLKQLPPEQQIVLKLRFFEDFTTTEIAEMLHKNEGAIRVTQHRALVKLKDMLSQINLRK